MADPPDGDNESSQESMETLGVHHPARFPIPATACGLLTGGFHTHPSGRRAPTCRVCWPIRHTSACHPRSWHTVTSAQLTRPRSATRVPSASAPTCRKTRSSRRATRLHGSSSPVSCPGITAHTTGSTRACTNTPRDTRGASARQGGPSSTQDRALPFRWPVTPTGCTSPSRSRFQPTGTDPSGVHRAIHHP